MGCCASVRAARIAGASSLPPCRSPPGASRPRRRPRRPARGCDAAPGHARRGGPEAKVVVVVGPVGSHNAHYKDDANEIVDRGEALHVNVVKLFTPERDLAAGQGRDAGRERVRVPRPRQRLAQHLRAVPDRDQERPRARSLDRRGRRRRPSTTARTTSGDNIRLAPNAVVLLYHLCYASGNTEPGLRSRHVRGLAGAGRQLRRRVHRRGRAGGLRRGPPGAPRRSHDAPAVHDQPDDGRRSSAARPCATATCYGPYPAERTPGLQYLMDPDSSTPSGFYRSIIGDLSLNASKVVDPACVPTRTRAPADFVVPGGAEVVAPEGAGAVGPRPTTPPTPRTPTPPTTLAARHPPAGDLRGRRRCADGTRILGVKVLGGSGERLRARLRARAARQRGRRRLVARREPALAVAQRRRRERRARGRRAVLRDRLGRAHDQERRPAPRSRRCRATGDIVRFAWDLEAAGALVPDGDYTWTLKAADAWGNPTVTRTGEFTDRRHAARRRRPGPTATAGANGWLVSPATVELTATRRDVRRPVHQLARQRGRRRRPTTRPGLGRDQRRRDLRVPRHRQGGRPRGVAQVSRSGSTPGRRSSPCALAGKAGDVAGHLPRPGHGHAVRPTTPARASRRSGRASTAAIREPLGDRADRRRAATATTRSRSTATDVAGNRERVSRRRSRSTRRDPVLDSPEPAEAARAR